MNKPKIYDELNELEEKLEEKADKTQLDEKEDKGAVRSVNGKGADEAGNVIVHLFPSTVRINLALPSNGGTITAPEDGYVCIGGTTDGNEHGTMVYLSARVAAQGYCYRSKAVNIFIPVCKGDVVTVGYEGVNIAYFDFVYAISTVS